VEAELQTEAGISQLTYLLYSGEERSLYKTFLITFIYRFKKK
jgi:hypothetical protein